MEVKIPNTELLYLKDDSVFVTLATCLNVEILKDKDKKKITEDDKNIWYNIILDKTVFYPETAGQSCDLGYIVGDDLYFKVFLVKKIAGKIHHVGFFENQVKKVFESNSLVTLKIDKSIRKLNSRLHTAGHLIDDALMMMGYTIETDDGTKASHKENNSYVEFKINTFNHDNSVFMLAIENIVNDLIQKNTKVQKIIVNKEDLVKCTYKQSFIPDNFDTIRVVITNGVKGIMCGGTHVEYLGEVGAVSINNLMFENNILKIKYSLKK